MAPWLIAIVGVVYFIIGFDLIRTGKSGLGFAFIAYAFANVGLYFDSLK